MVSPNIGPVAVQAPDDVGIVRQVEDGLRPVLQGSLGDRQPCEQLVIGDVSKSRERRYVLGVVANKGIKSADVSPLPHTPQ